MRLKRIDYSKKKKRVIIHWVFLVLLSLSLSVNYFFLSFFETFFYSFGIFV